MALRVTFYDQPGIYEQWFSLAIQDNFDLIK